MHEYYALYLGDNLDELNSRFTLGWTIQSTTSVEGRTMVILAKYTHRVNQLTESMPEASSARDVTVAATLGTDYGYTYTNRR